MPSDRQGGKKKPLKQQKKKTVDLDDNDIEFKRKQVEEKKQLKEMQEKAKGKKGMLNGGIKKSTSKKWLIVYYNHAS